MTKEEHLEAKGITEATGFHSYGYLYKSTLEAMDSCATDRLDSYKEALRSAIESLEKRKNKHYFPSQYDLAFNDAIDMVLQKLDSVTPKE